MVCASAQAKSAPAIPGGVVASASEKGHVLGSRQTGDVRGGPHALRADPHRPQQRGLSTATDYLQSWLKQA